MDWQYYKARKINKMCSGDYIFDDTLYKEAKKYGDKIAVLSNGFPIKSEPLLMETQYSRIQIIGSNIFYVDDNNTKHIIYQVREYRFSYLRMHFVDFDMRFGEGRSFRNYNNTIHIKNQQNNGDCE